MPLPDEKGTDVNLRWGQPSAVVVAEDADSKKLRAVQSEPKDGRLTLPTTKGDFRYVIEKP